MALNQYATTVQTFAKTPNGVQMFEFDRSPFLYEKTKVDEYGNQRVEHFYSIGGRKEEFNFLYPNGRIDSIPLDITSTYALFCVKVYEDRNAEQPIGMAHARESFNPDDRYFGGKFVEKAETFAIGRALSNAGIGSGFYLDETDANVNDGKQGETAISDTSGNINGDNTPPKVFEEMTEDELNNELTKALATIVTSCGDERWNGESFAKIMAIMANMQNYGDLLDELIEGGNEAEKSAAQILCLSYAESIGKAKEKAAKPEKKAKSKKNAKSTDTNEVPASTEAVGGDASESQPEEAAPADAEVNAEDETVGDAVSEAPQEDAAEEQIALGDETPEPEEEQGQDAAEAIETEDVAPAADEAPVGETSKDEYDPMQAVITTTTSSTLKGQTFEYATTKATNPAQFIVFLNSLIEEGTVEEREAARAILPVWEAKVVK